jgi:glycine cleavage system H lipoate-binding protein
MRCPYLKDARVKFCRASAFKKMIVQNPGQTEQEKCTTSSYLDCSVIKQQGGGYPLQSQCPNLQESTAQYCSAAPVNKLIPYSESQLSPCIGESHRYCEFYLGPGPGDRAAEPLTSSLPAPQSVAEAMAVDRVETIEVQEGLAYSANHMWLDMADDGICHIGVDAFLVRVLGCVEKLNFLSVKGVDRPTVALTVRGMDLHMVFPNRMLITRLNRALCSRPEKLATAPYSLGWLFEGKDLESGQVRAGLPQGEEARLWMRRELERLNGFVQNRIFSLPQRERRKALSCRTGPEQCRYLRRGDLIELFNEFFAPQADRREMT